MNEEIFYQEALDYLYRFIDYSLTRAFRYSPEKFDLTRMVVLLEKLGNPHQSYPVVHVAGTKGKGSVAALVSSALQAGGYRVGLYTSPHLQDFAERIQVNGANIPHKELAALVTEIQPYVDAVPGLTTFEITTALGFLYFSRQTVDIAVIEVGLGGRLDATNVVSPLVSVITSLSMDHMNILGDTLSKIAYEKAGIIKQDRPVVFAPQKSEALDVLYKIAEERNAAVRQVGKDILYGEDTHSLDGQTLWLWTKETQSHMDQFLEMPGKEDWEPVRLSIPLLGYHQIVNAATAYETLQVIRSQGIQIDEDSIQSGFERVVWPGRFEVLNRNPLVIVDSAHNTDSALKLRLTLDDYLPGIPVTLIFGASEDKDVQGMFAELLPRVKRVIATQSVHPRALEADKIVDLVHQAGRPARAIVPLEKALESAIEQNEEGHALVVTGSIFIAAAARVTWQSKITDRESFERP